MLKEEIAKIRRSDKVIVFADKTKNQYKVKVEDYKKRLLDSITTDYEIVRDEAVVKSVYSESAKIASSFKTGKDSTLADRIDRSSQNEAFVTYKDHKESFPGRIETRLINPSKNQIGHISKSILDNINKAVMKKTGLNLWRSSKDVISWFKSIPNKQECTFIKLDIQQYYPSISLTLLNKAIRWARRYVPIPKKDVDIIKHCRQCFVFHEGKAWQKVTNPQFDVTMGSVDSCELSELVGLYLLNGLKDILDEDQDIREEKH